MKPDICMVIALTSACKPWCLFLESPGNVSGPESCFLFVVFVFKIKVEIVLKIVQ